MVGEWKGSDIIVSRMRIGDDNVMLSGEGLRDLMI